MESSTAQFLWRQFACVQLPKPFPKQSLIAQYVKQALVSCSLPLVPIWTWQNHFNNFCIVCGQKNIQVKWRLWQWVTSLTQAESHRLGRRPSGLLSRGTSQPMPQSSILHKKPRRRRNRTPACLHAPWVEATSEHQPDSPPHRGSKMKKLMQWRHR